MRFLTYEEIEASERIEPQYEETIPVAVLVSESTNSPELKYSMIYSLNDAKAIEKKGGYVLYY